MLLFAYYLSGSPRHLRHCSKYRGGSDITADEIPVNLPSSKVLLNCTKLNTHWVNTCAVLVS